MGKLADVIPALACIEDLTQGKWGNASEMTYKLVVISEVLPRLPFALGEVFDACRPLDQISDGCRNIREAL